MKTIEQVVVELWRDDPYDFFGFKKEVLATYLPRAVCPRDHDVGLECARCEGKGVVELMGDEAHELTEEQVRKDMLDYLRFAFTKAVNHRGISASRSVSKLGMWAWILERDDLVTFAADDDNYAQYGVPILKRFAQAFDVPLPAKIKSWVNGQPCTPGCNRGCGT